MEKQKKNNIHRKIHQNNKLNLEKKIVGKKAKEKNTNRLGLNAWKMKQRRSLFGSGR